MKTLLVASEGGHLVELHQLSALASPAAERAWVTFDSPQSRSLLAGEEAHFAPFVGTRDLMGTAKATRWARVFLHRGQFDTVLSLDPRSASVVAELSCSRAVFGRGFITARLLCGLSVVLGSGAGFRWP
jgi:hypothetical protein